MSWEENTNEMLAAAAAEQAEVRRRQAAYNAMVAEKAAEEGGLAAARNVRQAGMTYRQKVKNNIRHLGNFPLPGLRGKPLGALSNRITNRANRAKFAQLSKLRALNRSATERAQNAAAAANVVRSAAGSKIVNAARRHLIRKDLRELAARPPGTMGPENTGGELYKLWESKAANRWARTRKARKSRRRRN